MMARGHHTLDSTAETAAHAFLSGWILRFGIPAIITTNRGVRFEAALCSGVAIPGPTRALARASTCLALASKTNKNHVITY